MKKILQYLFFGFVMFKVFSCPTVRADDLKLPYKKGESFIVVQGYDTPPTHVHKDAFALDFSQRGCSAYGKQVVAASPGKIIFAADGYNGGYGTEILVRSEGNILARYAHLVSGSIVSSDGDHVERGDILGKIGNTGFVVGAACDEHPGTHLHFGLYDEGTQGTLIARNPEPISGFSGVRAGNWYVSDNERMSQTIVLGESTTTIPVASLACATETPPLISAPAAIPISIASASTSIISPPMGGVAVIPNPSTSDNPISEAVPAAQESESPTSSILFSQAISEDVSSPSWYDDNWYDLGTGFSGTLTKLTLRGATPDTLPSLDAHIWLEAFKDADYGDFVGQFPIATVATLGDQIATATFDNLSIPFRPDLYYRLYTIEDRQNRSVLLAGTKATGTAMVDNFLYGTGRVEYQYPFFPFMIMEGVTASSI